MCGGGEKWNDPFNGSLGNVCALAPQEVERVTSKAREHDSSVTCTCTWEKVLRRTADLLLYSVEHPSSIFTLHSARFPAIYLGAQPRQSHVNGLEPSTYAARSLVRQRPSSRPHPLNHPRVRSVQAPVTRHWSLLLAAAAL